MTLEEFLRRGQAAQAAVDELISSITCPVCHRTSYNPHDIRERYCGACHRFHDDLPRGTSQTSGKSQT